MKTALDVLLTYPRGQDDGTWIKARAAVLDAHGYTEDGVKIPAANIPRC